jgi:hypothetical protein
MNELPEITNNSLKWYNARGQPHRDGDKPAIIEANGSVWYYKNGERYKP